MPKREGTAPPVRCALSVRHDRPRSGAARIDGLFRDRSLRGIFHEGSHLSPYQMDLSVLSSEQVDDLESQGRLIVRRDRAIQERISV